MSDLLESLRTQSPLPTWAPPPVPLPVGPYPTAVWPAGLTHLQPAPAATQPTGMVRAQWLIDANTKRYTDPHGTRWHMVASAHEATIRELADRVNVAEGRNLKAARGCSLAYLVFGPLEVAVEYEFERGQREIVNAEPDYCQEGIAPSVSVLRVYLNGYWCDAEDVASQEQIERWEQAILEGSDE